MKREGVTDFKVWPDDAPRKEYTSILYLQPATDRNSALSDFDMFTEEVRRQAMETARDTGKPTASGRVTLVQEQ